MDQNDRQKRCFRALQPLCRLLGKTSWHLQRAASIQNRVEQLDYDYNRYDTIRPSSSPTEGVSPIGLRPTNIAARLRSMLACGLGVSPRCSAYEAAYALAIARNHPSMDGNKRSAFVALETVLVLNGHELVAGDVEATVMMLDMAAGTPATGASDAGLHSIQRLNLAQQT